MARKEETRKADLSKILPHNLEAEEALLGSIFIDPDGLLKIVDALTPKDFYSPANGVMFEVMIDLFNAYRDNPKTLPKEVFDSFESNHQLEQHVADYVAGMTDRFALDEHKKLFDPNEKV